jgi:hypothetical protein
MPLATDRAIENNNVLVVSKNRLRVSFSGSVN